LNEIAKPARSGPSRGRARHVARVARWHTRDVIRRPRAHERADTPAFAWSVTPQWLTAVLCDGTPASVARWRYEPVSRGSTCRGRYHLEYEGDIEAQLPPTVFVKSTSTFRTRLQVGSLGAIRAESRYYRDIQPIVDVLSPVGYFGASDRRTGRAILLIEDITRTRNVTFGDNRSVHVDRAMASSVVDTLATLHGALLESPRLANDLRWVISSMDLQRHLNALVDFERRTQVGLDRASDLVPTALMARRRDIHAYLMASFALDADRPTGLVHTDVHAGNWFVTADRQMGLLDWAALARGQGPRDLAYALMSNLTLDDRRSWERELVEQYADTVAAVSGRPSQSEEVWTCYRQQTLHGLYFWLYTLGRGIFQPSMQADEISRINIARMAQAVVDLDTFSSLSP
jgi:aminoglycoside phosphotransferase (APT) family kinase protein